jgi:hypothetical protein
MRETYESALLFGAETLRGMGVDAETADGIVADVRRRDADRLAEQRSSGDVTVGWQPVPEPLVPPVKRGVDRTAAE